jgi:Ser/Thr protein kinase RdoA (MazF antagonist)
MFEIPGGIAERALERWRADPGPLTHIATFGNTVYRFSEDGVPRILRLTHPAHRTPDQTRAEMAFLDHLGANGVRVNVPVRSRAGHPVETIDGCSACVLTWIPGIVVTPDSEHWNGALFREWGASLARIHSAATGYTGPARWTWYEEDLVVRAPDLIPAGDTEVRAEFDRLIEVVQRLPQHDQAFGMTHADYAPGNFHYVPGEGIHAFDFGNCCTHGFVSDLAISLSVLRHHRERDRYRAWLLSGYRGVRAIDPEWLAHLDDVIRLRIMYVLLSRLEFFGPHPDDVQRVTLAALRSAVLERFTWPMEAHP